MAGDRPAGWSVTRKEKCATQSFDAVNAKNGTGYDTETIFVRIVVILLCEVFWRMSDRWSMSVCWQSGKEQTNVVPIYVLCRSVCFQKSPIVSPIQSTSSHQMSQNLMLIFSVHLRLLLRVLALRPSFGRWNHRSYSTKLSFTPGFPKLSLVFSYSG